jgi:hypothetical protein
MDETASTYTYEYGYTSSMHPCIFFFFFFPQTDLPPIYMHGVRAASAI